MVHIVVSLNRGEPNIDPQNTIVLTIGTPKMVPIILGNPNPYNPLYNPSFHFIFHFLFHLILHYSRYPYFWEAPKP